MLLLFFCIILLGHALPSCLSVRLSGRLVIMGIFIRLWLEVLAILAEGAIALSVTHSLLLRDTRIALHACISITWSMKGCTQHKRHAEIKLLVLI